MCTTKLVKLMYFRKMKDHQNFSQLQISLRQHLTTSIRFTDTKLDQADNLHPVGRYQNTSKWLPSSHHCQHHLHPVIHPPTKRTPQSNSGRRDKLKLRILRLRLRRVGGYWHTSHHYRALQYHSNFKSININYFISRVLFCLESFSWSKSLLGQTLS